MAGRQRGAQARPRRARAAVAALPRAAAQVPALRRIAPSRRSVLIGFGIAAIAAGAYVAARESSAFAVTRIEVRGGPVAVRHEVRKAVGPLRGSSLLSLDGAALVRRVEALPTVLAAGYDRSFPHTLRVQIVPERPVAVLRRGRSSWLVSARARVIARLRPHAAERLPRIWVPRRTDVAVGAFLEPAGGATAARTIALAARFPARIATVSLAHGELVFRLRSGIELLLGEPTDVRLKLAIARRALRRLPPGSTYVDVSVPGRPVAGANSQLSGRD
jgi:cell division protein FtsQ